MKIIAQKSKLLRNLFIAILNTLVENKLSPLYQLTLLRINRGDFSNSQILKNFIKKNQSHLKKLQDSSKSKSPLSQEQKDKNIQQLEEYLKHKRLEKIEEQLEESFKNPFSNLDVNPDLEKIEAKNWYSLFKSQNHMYF